MNGAFAVVLYWNTFSYQITGGYNLVNIFLEFWNKIKIIGDIFVHYIEFLCITWWIQVLQDDEISRF